VEKAAKAVRAVSPAKAAARVGRSRLPPTSAAIAPASRAARADRPASPAASRVNPVSQANKAASKVAASRAAANPAAAVPVDNPVAAVDLPAAAVVAAGIRCSSSPRCCVRFSASDLWFGRAGAIA